MKNLGRWSLAVAILAISGGTWLDVVSDRAPAAISKPSAAVEWRPLDSAGDRTTQVQHADTALAPGPGQVIKENWAAQFHSMGSNYFEFVTGAAQAAYRGDGAAQYYIGQALTRCEETNTLYRDADSADQAVSHLAFAPALLERERQEYLNCGKLRSESPFKGLPEHQGGYPAEYWRIRAVESRYPVAMVAAALDSPGEYPPQLIATALATGNADAMLLFGWSQATTAKATESAPIMGAAWVLAACHSGANCGPTNDAESYSAADELTASLSAQDLDQANLLARDIQSSLIYRDPSRLTKYLPF